MKPTFAEAVYFYVQNRNLRRNGRKAASLGRAGSLASRFPTLLFALLAGMFLVSAISPAFAQAPVIAARPRLTANIDESQRTFIPGNLHPRARTQNEQGVADQSLKLERITMMFQQTAAQQADLSALLAAQQNPNSPSFHQWLTPAQYGDRFGIAQSDLDKISAWLQSKGFKVVETPASRNLIVFNGTAGQVNSAFQAGIRNYISKGKSFYANSSEPSVPAAFAGMVSGFRGLNNFPIEPQSIRQSPSSSNVKPDFTSSLSGNHFLSPGDLAVIYDMNTLYGSSPAIDGTGQKIVVVGQSQIVLSDIATFRSLSGLPPNVPQVHFVPDATDPGVVDSDVQESSLDVEWAGAVAKNATIHFVYSGLGVFDAMQYAITQNYAPIISISYGGCEAQFSSSDISLLASMAQQANAQGITIVSSIGDGGATDCDSNLGNYPAVLGLNVDIPGALPYVTAVGGTEFNEGNGTYWQSTSGTDIVTSALSYIPEKVWNDTLLNGSLDAGGGGASSIFGKPTWQTGTGVPADGARDVPDVAFAASDSHDSYLVCSRVPGSLTVPSCQNGFRISTGNNGFTSFGGTSFGAPIFAGVLALVNQKTGSTGQGNINYLLYPLAATSPTAFHDITTGDNTSPCILGTENCPSGGTIGFAAGTGYDQATGLGSIDITNFVNAWHLVTGSGGSTPVLSTISPTTTAAGSAAFTLTATGSGFATTAQILWNGSTEGVTMLSGGTATTIKATISPALVAYGTTASVTVNSNSPTAGVSSAAQTFTVTSTPPVNDNIANAIFVTSNFFTSTVDNSSATTETTDPTTICAVQSTSPRTKTVWWTLIPASSGTVTATTIGSVYDTTLSVWTGTPGSLTAVACSDDISSGVITQSGLTFAATAGTKYYFMVAPFGPPDTGLDLLGGKTVLNVSNGNPVPPQAPAITSANTATFTAGTANSFTVTATGSPAPTLSESGALPTGVLFTAGTGALSGTPLATGTFPITFTAHNGIGSDATQNFTLTVNPGILSATPSSQSVAAGSSATYAIKDSSLANAYTLTCTGLPTGASCATVSVPANSTASLVITTTSRTLGVLPPHANRRIRIDLRPEFLALLGMALLAALVIRKRRTMRLIPVGVFALLILLAAGCGGGGGSSGGSTVNPNGTPAGTYAITVTGTSGGSTQVTLITLTVT